MFLRRLQSNISFMFRLAHSRGHKFARSLCLLEPAQGEPQAIAITFTVDIDKAVSVLPLTPPSLPPTTAPLSSPQAFHCFSLLYATLASLFLTASPFCLYVNPPRPLSLRPPSSLALFPPHISDVGQEKRKQHQALFDRERAGAGTEAKGAFLGGPCARLSAFRVVTTVPTPLNQEDSVYTS